MKQATIEIENKRISPVMKVFNRIVDSMETISCFLIMLMMLAVSADVVGRYFLNRPIRGVIEISEYEILWIAFLGAAWVLKKEGHVSMDFITYRLKTRTRKILSIITSVFGAIISLIVCWYGFAVFFKDFRAGTYEVGNIKIMSAWVEVIIPIGCLFLGIQFLVRAYEYWAGTKAAAGTRSTND